MLKIYNLKKTDIFSQYLKKIVFTLYDFCNQTQPLAKTKPNKYKLEYVNRPTSPITAWSETLRKFVESSFTITNGFHIKYLFLCLCFTLAPNNPILEEKTKS